MRVLSFPFLARPSEGLGTLLVKINYFCYRDDVHEMQNQSRLACDSELFGPEIRINLKKLTKCVDI